MISGERWMFMCRSEPESWSFTRLVSQAPRTDPMSDPQSDIQGLPPASTRPVQALRATVLESAAALGGAGEGNGATGTGGAGHRPVTLERPKRAEVGDYSTNGAPLLAPALGPPPREIAERLGAALQERLGGDLDRFEVAGPGFVNLFMSDGWCRAALAGGVAARARVCGG